MSKLASYDQINGPVHAKDGNNYKTYGSESSNGTSGTFHVYEDGRAPIFVAGATPDAPSAPDPAPVAAPNPGGAVAPDNTAPADSAPAPAADPTSPAAPASDGSLLSNTSDQPATSDTLMAGTPEYPFTNNEPGSPRNGHHFKVGETTTNSRGDSGVTRIYADGSRIFIADPKDAAPAAQYLESNPAGVSPLSPAVGGTSPLNQLTATHLVQQGESLSKIADQNGLTLDQIVKLNPTIENPRFIVPGQVVNISGPNQSFPAAPAADSSFTAPTTSTYPPPEGSHDASQKAKNLTGGMEAPGGAAPADPALGAIAFAPHADTNPIKAADLKNIETPRY